MAHQAPQPSGAAASEEAPRRGFLKKALAVVIGGFISLFPAAAGLAVFVDPLRSRKMAGGGAEGFLKVLPLDALQVGVPRRVTIIADRHDAWNFFPQQPVGAVYLMRQEDGSVIALNVTCPHAGCSVDFVPDRAVYQCPCHDSSFHPSGEIANERSPAPRGLDTLEVDAEKLKSGEVWVKYQNFRSAVPEKIAET